MGTSLADIMISTLVDDIGLPEAFAFITGNATADGFGDDQRRRDAAREQGRNRVVSDASAIEA